jgi:hypothetical protein
MSELGLFGQLRAREVEKIIQVTFATKEPNESLSMEEFIQGGLISADLINCFGALRFVAKHTIERATAPPGQKEGFLLKHYKNVVEKWTYHWCVVSGGLFYYYNDLENVRVDFFLFEKFQKFSML